MQDPNSNNGGERQIEEWELRFQALRRRNDEELQLAEGLPCVETSPTDDTSQQEDSDGSTSPSPAKDSSKKRWLFSLLVLLVILGASLGAYFGMTKASETSGGEDEDNQTKDIETDDYSTVEEKPSS